jgi:hypothetical protein
VKFRESDTDDSDKIYENVEYEAVLDDPTVHDILQDSGTTTTGITNSGSDERDKTHDEIPIPTVKKEILTPDESDNTVPFPTPEQTPEYENLFDNSEYSTENSGPNEAEITEGSVGRHIREKKTRNEEFTTTVVTRGEPADQIDSSVRKSGRNSKKEPGYYKTLHKKGLGTTKSGTSYTNLQAIAEPTLQAGLCLTALKAEHIVNYNPNLPKNYRQARKLPDFESRWLPAMKKQFERLESRKTWDLCARPKGEKILPGKWVYDEKIDPDNSIRARARWVVCGNYEENSWAIQDTYAAVANATSLRVFIAIAAIKDLEIYQFDFDTAYLNATIPFGIDIYVEQPHGFEQNPDLVCRLKNALYGLRRSALYWFKTLAPIMRKLGWEPFDSDICLFKHEKLGALLILYVDDLLIAAPTVQDVHEIRDAIGKFFKLKNMGPVKRFLGYEILRDRDNRQIYLSQEGFARKILLKYGWDSMNPVQTPWPANLQLPKQWVPQEIEKKDYIKRTGSLNYLATGTRPDISYTVSKLCEANSGPSDEHKALLKHLARYINHVPALSIRLGGKLPDLQLNLHAFADAAFADDVLTRHSTGGHVIFYGGGLVHWKTRKQTIVTLSSTEAEFINLTPTGLAVKWIKQILTEAGCPQSEPLILFTDSANARKVVLNPLNSARTRNIDVHYKWIIQEVDRKVFKLEHIAGTEMVADGLTKPLGREKHAKFVKLLGFVERPEGLDLN